MTTGQPVDPKAEEARRAELRMRDEMSRQRRAEEAQIKALKFGCIGVITLMVLLLVLGFLLS